MILTKTKRKSFDLDLEIDQRIKQHGLDSLLLIVPTNRRIRALTREMVSRSPGKAAGKMNLETIGSVSTKLLFNSDSVRSAMITEAAASVLLQQSFSETRLEYFSNYGGEIPKGTLERIRNVIGEYKRHGINPNKIRLESQSLTGSEKIKALDIANVYEKYQLKISSSFRRETGDIYNELLALGDKDFLSNFASLYPGVNLIIIQGFDEFTLPEIEIINRLSSINKIELFISFDYFRYNPLIFSHLDNCYENLLSRGFAEIPDKSVSLFTQFQDENRENLFTKKGSAALKDYKDRIKTISASTREEEIKSIASEIKQLVLHDNMRPEEICVVFNLISNYSDIIRDVFPLYGLPYNLTDRFPLDIASPVVAFISFLEIAENDFYYKNIFRALSGGIISAGGIDVTNLMRLSTRLKIISGYDSWQRSLNEALISAEENESGNYDAFEIKKSCTAALKDIGKLRDYLEPFLVKSSIPDFREKLHQVIPRLEIPVRLLSGGIEDAGMNIKSVNVFIETADEILSLLEDQFGKEEKFPLKFYLHNLRMAVSSSRFNIREKPGYGVQITTMNEIRGLKFSVLFIGGLCDGDFPTRFSPEIFFSGSMARTRGERNHLTEERYLFYQSLCAWNKKLYLTYPRRDERKEFVQSDFLREFMNCFEVTTGDEQDYKNTIYTKEQLLTFIGRYGVEKTEQLVPLAEASINKDEINEAMRIDSLRSTEPFGESVYTGFISDDLSEAAEERLDKMGERQFSITQLETYALCPYRYFAERVLRLDIFEEPTEEIEALELGSLIHAILFTFYSKLKEQNIVLGGCSETVFLRAEKILFQTAEKMVGDINFNSPLSFFEKEKIFGVGGDRKNSILYKFLASEREDNEGFVPEFFETGFGSVRKEQGQEVLLNELKAGEVNVRGKIDRIDINSDENLFRVYDYKTGKKDLPMQDVYAGLKLQLPLYLFAAKEIIKAELDEDYKPAGALLYSLKYNASDFGKKGIGFGKNKTPEETAELFDELIETCVKAINSYVEGISRGDFRLSQIDKREEKACRFCGFRAICRIQEAG